MFRLLCLLHTTLIAGYLIQCGARTARIQGFRSSSCLKNDISLLVCNTRPLLKKIRRQKLGKPCNPRFKHQTDSQSQRRVTKGTCRVRATKRVVEVYRGSRRMTGESILLGFRGFTSPAIILLTRTKPFNTGSSNTGHSQALNTQTANP